VTALTPADRRLILAALADASRYRQLLAVTQCTDAAGMCAVHQGDADQADAYDALAGRLGDDR
jgi:hypothetical protein